MANRYGNVFKEGFEKWIDGYEDMYSITTEGKIFSYQHRHLKEIVQCIDKSGYKRVLLHDRGVRKNYTVSRLVAKAFVKNDDLINRICVNHIDGNKINNNSYNLEWVTGTENIRHAYRLGLIHTPRGEESYACKLKDIQVKQIRCLCKKNKEYNLLYKDIAKMFNVAQTTISKIRTHKARCFV